MKTRFFQNYRFLLNKSISNHFKILQQVDRSHQSFTSKLLLDVLKKTVKLLSVANGMQSDCHTECTEQK